MYCLTCELEIKGEGKQTCPICGGALTAGLEDSASAGSRAQDHPALHDIIEDINSLFDDGAEPAGGSPDQETVFVLKDYDDDSTTVNEPVQVQEVCADEPEQHASAVDDVFRDADASLQDRLDSIKQSLVTPDAAEAETEKSDGAVQEDSEEFVFPQSFEPDGVFPDENAAGQAVLAEFDGDGSSLVSANPDETRRRPALVIALLVVMLVGVGYYAYRFIAAGSSDEKPLTVRTVMPLSALKAGQNLQADAQRPAAGSSVSDMSAAPLREPSAGSAAADAGMPASGAAAQPERVTDSTAGPSESAAAGGPPAEAAGTPGASADNAMAAVQPETVSPRIEKPAGPSQPPAQDKDVLSAAPVRDSPGLQSVPADLPPAAAQPKKRAAAAAAPFYTVHVGSYRSRDTAASEANRIRAKGHDAFVERAELGQRGTWFRVKVGRFQTRAEAESLKEKIHKALVPESVVVKNGRD